MAMRPQVANKGGRPIYRPKPARDLLPDRDPSDSRWLREDEMRIQHSYVLHAIRLRAAWILRETGVLVIPSTSLSA